MRRFDKAISLTILNLYGVAVDAVRQGFQRRVAEWRRLQHLLVYLKMRREAPYRGPHGLNPQKAATLTLIWRSRELGEWLNQKDLAQRMRLKAPRMNQIIAGVVKAQFCRTVLPPVALRQSLRGSFYGVTSQGKRALAQWTRWEFGEVVDASVPSNFDLQPVVALLDQFIPNLKRLLQQRLRASS